MFSDNHYKYVRNIHPSPLFHPFHPRVDWISKIFDKGTIFESRNGGDILTFEVHHHNIVCTPTTSKVEVCTVHC